MSLGARIMAYGGTGLLVIAGVVCVAVFGAGTGQFVGFTLIGVGLVLATGLAFLEVGLSEDRERAREQRQVRPPERPKRSGRLVPPRPERSRGHRRRLG